MSLDMKEMEKSIDPKRSSSRSTFNGRETEKRGREGAGNEDESVTNMSDLRNPCSKVDGAVCFEEDSEAPMGALKHGSSATSLQSDPSESSDDQEKTPNSEGSAKNSPFAASSRRPHKARKSAALLRLMSLGAHTTTHVVHEDLPLGEDETPEEPAGDAPGSDSQEDVVGEGTEKVGEKEEKISTEMPVNASFGPDITGGFVFGQNLVPRIENAAPTSTGFCGLGGFAALAQLSGGASSSGSGAAPAVILFARSMQQAQTATAPDAMIPAVNGKAPKEAANPVVPFPGSARKKYEAKTWEGKGGRSKLRSTNPFVLLVVCWFAAACPPSCPVRTLEAADTSLGVHKRPGDTILMTPMTRLKLGKDSTSEVICTVIHGDGLVECEPGGELVSGTQPGEAVVEVKFVENGKPVTHKRQIKIAYASKVTLSAPVGLPGNPSLPYTPVGLVLRLHVSYVDSLGRLFDAVPNNLYHRLSRDDVVEVSWSGENNNRSLIVHCRRPGTVIVEVVDADKPSLANHFEIRVESAIVPHSLEVEVGGCTCFHCKLLTPEGRHGFWTSSSPGILYIDKASGVSVAVSEGTATVAYHLSDGAAAEALLTVQPVSTISMGPPRVEKLPSSSSKPYEDAHPLELAFPVLFGRGRSETCDGSQIRDLAKVKREVWNGTVLGLFGCEIGFGSVYRSGTTAADVFSVRPDVDEAGDFICRVMHKPGRYLREEGDNGLLADLIVTATDVFGHLATGTGPQRVDFSFPPPVNGDPDAKGGTWSMWSVIIRTLVVGGILIVLVWAKLWFARTAGPPVPPVNPIPPIPPGPVPGGGVPQPAAFAKAIAAKVLFGVLICVSGYYGFLFF